MTDPLRFAVLGCGRMGARRMKTIQENKDAELVCITDLDKEKARRLANETECDYDPDYRKCVGRHDVDVVVISLPNGFHLEASVLALKNGKHTFCEKPLARTPDEARLMVSAAKESGVSLKTGSNLRYFPNVLRAKELIDIQKIGELLFVRGWIGHSGASKLGTWFLDPEMAGGGTYLDNGCHLLDLTRWFLGEVAECQGFVATVHWPVTPLDDIGLGIFKTRDGKLAFIQSSWVEWADYMYMEVYGKNGFLRIDNRNPSCHLTLGRVDGTHELLDYSHIPANSYTLELEDYVQAIRDGKQPVPSGYDGMRVVQMVHAVYESSRSGKKIDLSAQ